MASFVPLATNSEAFVKVSVLNSSIKSATSASWSILNVGVLVLVILSEDETPVSEPSTKSGADEVVNGVVSTIIASSFENSDRLPA